MRILPSRLIAHAPDPDVARAEKQYTEKTVGSSSHAKHLKDGPCTLAALSLKKVKKVLIPVTKFGGNPTNNKDSLSS
jgi:hypothetical protein